LVGPWSRGSVVSLMQALRRFAPQGKLRERRTCFYPTRAPHLTRRRAILLTKRRVETAKTLKAARVRDLNHGIVRVGEETLGVRESVRLRECARRDAERAGRNSPSGRVSKPNDGVDRSTPGTELRPTTEARPESRLLRFDRR